MNHGHRFVINLGPVDVCVETDHTDLIDYLCEFYPITTVRADRSPAWTIRAHATVPELGMMLTPWGVGYQPDPSTRVLTICSTNERDVAVTVRKAVREVLVDYCEIHRYTMLHASAVADDTRVILIVGESGSGKTTLALNAALTRGYRYLSNDHLIIYRGDDGLVVTSLPTPIPIKIGTYLDYEDRLGSPWDDEGVDIDTFRAMPPTERYSYPRRLLFTFARLGQSHPLHIPLSQRQVTVVLAGYTRDGKPVEPAPVSDPAAALWPHVRFDWVFDPVLNTHYLPRHERPHDEYTHDSRNLLADLTASAPTIEWRHRGELSPLLAWLDTGADAPL